MKKQPITGRFMNEPDLGRILQALADAKGMKIQKEMNVNVNIKLESYERVTDKNDPDAGKMTYHFVK